MNFLLLIGFLAFLVGCVTNLPPIAPDATAMEISQRGQEYLDIKQYDKAKEVYELLLERYGQDSAVYAEANFEIGHIYIKQKKWEDAYIILSALHNMYELGLDRNLPPSYGRLTELDLEKIPEEFRNPIPLVDSDQTE